MKEEKVMCPYDGSGYSDVPGGKYKSSVCPYCDAKSPNPDAEWNEVKYPHQKVERTLLTNEEAEEILKKYVKKHWVNGRQGYAYNAGEEILEYAWYSQHWPTYAIQGNGYSKRCDKRDWMGDDLKLAFEWYLDGVGRDLGYGHGRAKGTFEKGYKEKLAKELTEMAKELQQKKWEQQRASKDKRENKLIEQGKKFKEEMQIGEVWMVKFGGWWGERGILVFEKEGNSLSGFYLDHDDKTVPGDAPEKEGFFYTKPSKYDTVKVKGKDGKEIYVPGKREWDGKTFIRTKTYESKMYKFVRRKIEKPIIEKS